MDATGRKKHIITLGGLPGSGKSTIKKLLAERLSYQTFSTGDFVREMAVERGLTLEELNEVIAKSKEIDEKIDEELIRIENKDDKYVIDSHLAFHFVPSGFSVFLETSLDESAERIFNDSQAEMRVKSGDTMKTLAEAKERTEKRIKNHKDRYMRHYGIDPYTPSNYNYVIDTIGKTPEEIANSIESAYMDWLQS